MLAGEFADEFFLAGRLIFGVPLFLFGVYHFMEHDNLTDYAAAHGVPMASFNVIATAVMLLLGSAGLILGVYPVVAAGMLAVFFLVVTAFMHRFWEEEDPEQREHEMVNFLKNIMLLGTSLIFIALSGTDWSYAINVGFFV